MTELSKFEKKIGITFKNKDLLTQAFLHRSYLNEHKDMKMPHNERLEFLGDAVLELVVTDFLFNKYKDKSEGELTAIRAALVNAVLLGEIATSLGVNDFLLLSRGEAKDHGRARQVILANTYEAIVGAIYLDQGYEGAKKFIADNLLDKTDEIVEKGLWLDAKSFFQERAQDVEGITPKYKVLEQSGPDHNKKFTVGLYIGERLISKGTGHSKQEAEQAAAQQGLEIMHWRAK